jgi:hypothetical protein
LLLGLLPGRNRIMDVETQQSFLVPLDPLLPSRDLVLIGLQLQTPVRLFGSPLITRARNLLVGLLARSGKVSRMLLFGELELALL